MPNPDVQIHKLGQSADFRASAVAIDRVGQFFVTAARDDGATLVVTSWFLGPDGTPVAYDQHVAGQVGLVDIRCVAEGVFATTVENASGNLEIITWTLGPLGTITRHEETSFGGISAVATDAFQRFRRLVVAMVDAGGKLRIKLIDIDPETYALTQVDNEIADDASLVDIEVTDRRLVNLYTRNAEQNLQVTAFLHGRNDLRPSRGEPYVSGNLGAIVCAKRGGLPRHTLGSRVALIDSHGGLRVTSFKFSRNLQERGVIDITRNDSIKGPVGKAISIASHERDHGYWTAVETPDHKLEVRLWGHGWPLGHAPDDPPTSIAHAVDDETVQSVVCTAPWGGYRLVTAAVTNDDRLVMTSWKADGVQESHD